MAPPTLTQLSSSGPAHSVQAGEAITYVCQSTFDCGAEVQGNRSHPKHGGIYGSEYGVEYKRSPRSPVCPSAPLDVRVTSHGLHDHLHCGEPAEVIRIFDLVWLPLFSLLLPMKVLTVGSF